MGTLMADMKLIVAWVTVIAACVGVVVLTVWAMRSVFGREARERRRRARSHGKVVSRGRGSWIHLAVKTKKPKKDQ